MANPFHCIPDEEFDSTRDAFEYLLDDSAPAYAGILLDVDGVMVDVDGRHSPPEVGSNVSAHLVELLKAVDDKYGVCIVTNRIRYDDFAPETLESVFDVPVITGTKRKPSSEIFYAGMAQLGLDTSVKENVVMIGDSSYYDIYGAGKAGLQTFQIDQDRSKYPLPNMAGKLLADGIQSVFKGIHRLRNGHRN